MLNKDNIVCSYKEHINEIKKLVNYPTIKNRGLGKALID